MSSAAKRAIEAIHTERIVAIIREQSVEDALFCAEVAFGSGITCLEFTFGGADVGEAVRLAAQRCKGAHIGVGTTMTKRDLSLAKKAGACFAISPHFDRKLVRHTVELGLASIPGSMTPSEIQASRAAGASLVKVFPVVVLGGAAYVRQLLVPLRGAQLIATGGVRVENASELMAAGVVAVGAATDLFNPKWVASRDSAAMTAQAKRYRIAVGRT